MWKLQQWDKFLHSFAAGKSHPIKTPQSYPAQGDKLLMVALFDQLLRVCVIVDDADLSGH